MAKLSHVPTVPLGTTTCALVSQMAATILGGRERDDGDVAIRAAVYTALKIVNLVNEFAAPAVRAVAAPAVVVPVPRPAPPVAPVVAPVPPATPAAKPAA